MRRRLIFALVVSILVATACGSPPPEISTLEQARSRWEASGVSSYRYTIERFCLCPLVVKSVTVTDGVVSAVETTPDGESTSGMTIDQLFDEIDRILAGGDLGEMSVDYDPDRGYPAQVTADPVRKAVDDEFSYTVTDFADLSG